MENTTRGAGGRAGCPCRRHVRDAAGRAGAGGRKRPGGTGSRTERRARARRRRCRSTRAGPGAGRSARSWTIPAQPLYNTTKQKMLEGKQVFSQTITQFDVKAYCEGAAKYDFSRFEMQHATLRFDEVEKMIAACPRAAATPILRIPDATETNVQRAVDIGVLGIIVPTVDDAIESRSVAMFARFPPIARRSTGGGQAGSIWSPVIQKPKTFRSTINDNMLVIVMIETQEGVKNALEIASQPGVDVVIIGNADFESFSGFAPDQRGLPGSADAGPQCDLSGGEVLGQREPWFCPEQPAGGGLAVPPGRAAGQSEAEGHERGGDRRVRLGAQCGIIVEQTLAMLLTSCVEWPRRTAGTC